MNSKFPVLRRAKAQAEAGPLMLMMRRANMGASIAGGGGNRKGPLRVDAQRLFFSKMLIN